MGRKMGVESLQRLVDWSNVLYIVAVVLSVCFAGVTIYCSRRLTQAKDTQSKLEMQLANVKIGEAGAEAAKAHEGAAKARADAATAKADAAKANKESIALRTDLQLATAEAHSKQTELARQQEKLAKAQEERAVAQLALEKTLEDVRERQMPRTLTPEQRTHLIELLKGDPKGEVAVECVLGDGEGDALAFEFAGLLRAADWSIEEGGVKRSTYRGANPRGVWIAVRNAKTAPKSAVRLQQAFSEIGFPLNGVEIPTLPEGTVILRIGMKE